MCIKLKTEARVIAGNEKPEEKNQPEVETLGWISDTESHHHH